jgi:hypothetical protein
MIKSPIRTILLAAVNVALAAVVVGCGESVPQRSAQGGVLSGTHTERQRYANRRNPLLAGNAPEEVGQSSAAPSTLAPTTPREPRTAGAPTATPAAGSSAPTPDAGATEGTTPAAPAEGAAPTTPAQGTGTGTVGSPAGTGADPGATASPESAVPGTPRAGAPAATPRQ